MNKQKTKKGGIKRYCNKHKIRITDLASIAEITSSQLYLLDKDPMYPAQINTLMRIYEKTKEKFGDGLKPSDFLDFEILHLAVHNLGIVQE